MADEPTSVPDEQLVTWGELRKALHLVSAYHSEVAVFTTIGIASAMGSSTTSESIKAAEGDVREAAKAVRDFAGFNPMEDAGG